MAPPRILFCVGATKAGTSWLYRYLSDHPDCHLRTIKELHFFDALEKQRVGQDVAGFKVAIEAMEAKILAQPHENLDYRAAYLEDRKAFIHVLRSKDPAAYLRYVSGGAPEGALLADITPAYALLPEDRLSQMVGLSDQAQFLYLMRDPVERLWSHVRMMAKRQSQDGRATLEAAHDILSRTLAGDEPQIAIRCDYIAAIDRLQAAIPPDRLCLAFYEDLFGGQGLAKICAFLGIKAVPGDLAKRAHAGQPLAMAPEARIKVRAWLEGQYQGVAERVGDIPGTWKT